MTFSPPYAGVFAYKGLIPSTFLNAVNNDLPNALDKTGDTVTGEIVFGNGALLEMQSGSTLEIFGGSSLFLLGGNFVAEDSSIFNFGQDNSAVTLNMYGATITTFKTSSVLNLQGITNLSGPLYVSTGAVANFANNSHLNMTAGNNITLGGTTPTQVFPSLSNPGGITRSYIQSVIPGVDATNNDTFQLNWSVLNNSISEFQTGGGSQWVCSLRMHDGATISNVQLNYAIQTTHAAPTGTNRLSISLWRVGYDGSSTQLGITFATTYSAGGAFISFVPTPVVINNAAYSYQLLIIDETSASAAGNAFYSIGLSFSDITSSVWSQ